MIENVSTVVILNEKTNYILSWQFKLRLFYIERETEKKERERERKREGKRKMRKREMGVTKLYLGFSYTLPSPVGMSLLWRARV